MDKMLQNQLKMLQAIKPDKNWAFLSRSQIISTLGIGTENTLKMDDSFLDRLFHPLARLVFKTAYVFAVISGILIIGSGTTVWLATKSMPGTPLYPLKISIEKVRLLAAYSQTDKIRLQTDMVSRRVEEMKTIVNSSGSDEEKNRGVQEAVGQLYQHLLSVNETLPKVDGNGSSQGKTNAAKVVSEKTDQIAATLTQVRQSLSTTDEGVLNDKIAEVADTADKTSTQALEIVAQTSPQDAVSKIEGKIQETEQKIRLVQQMAQATSTDGETLSINAVLIKDQSEIAQELLEQAKNDLKQQNVSGAIQTIQAVNDIVKGTERLVQNVSSDNQDNQNQTNFTSTSTDILK